MRSQLECQLSIADGRQLLRLGGAFYPVRTPRSCFAVFRHFCPALQEHCQGSVFKVFPTLGVCRPLSINPTCRSGQVHGSLSSSADFSFRRQIQPPCHALWLVIVSPLLMFSMLDGTFLLCESRSLWDLAVAAAGTCYALLVRNWKPEVSTSHWEDTGVMEHPLWNTTQQEEGMNDRSTRQHGWSRNH